MLIVSPPSSLHYCVQRFCKYRLLCPRFTIVNFSRKITLFLYESTTFSQLLLVYHIRIVSKVVTQKLFFSQIFFLRRKHIFNTSKQYVQINSK